MFRRGLLIVVVWLLLLAFAAQATVAQEPPGAKLYSTYCGACHGAGGKGGFAPVIGDEKYLSSYSDDAIAKITGEGVAGKGMPAWSKANGGTLTNDQINSIVAFLRSLSSTRVTPATPMPASVAVTDYVQTKMTVAQMTNTNGNIIISATLKDFNDKPVVGASIGFVHTATFGNIDLGTSKTDNAGVASVILFDAPGSSRLVDVAFKGNASFGASSGRVMARPQVAASSSGTPNLNSAHLSIGDEPLLQPEGSLITQNPPLVPTMIFLGVVLGIWATYGYVVAQVVGIWKNRPRTPRRNVFKTRIR